MECPYCGKEMTQGYLNNRQKPIQWIPDGKDPGFLNYMKAKDGVTLENEFNVIDGYNAEAHYCSECMLVIAPTER